MKTFPKFPTFLTTQSITHVYNIYLFINLIIIVLLLPCMNNLKY